MKYRKKPVVIEAVQYTGDNTDEIIKFANGKIWKNTCYSYLTVPTLEGLHRADVGDWIVKGIKGEFYPCKPDIFDATYEPAQSTHACCSPPVNHSRLKSAIQHALKFMDETTKI